MRAIQISELGGPEVLELVELDNPAPGEGEVVIETEAIGVNFIDTYQRAVLYPVDLPFVPGNEVAGTVIAVGPGVERFATGDRVAVLQGPGAYAEQMRASAELCVAVPEGLGTDIAGAALLQGMTAHYLAHDTYPLRAGDACLIHAGAGGTGRLLIQMAKRAGATVFTTVGSEQKANIAGAAGADHVIRYDEVNFAEAIL